MNTKKPSSAHPDHAGNHSPHFDGSGHIDPNHAKRLLELGRQGRDAENEDGFVGVAKSKTSDPLAEELAEAAVTSMTTGEEQLTEDLEAVVEEERGGPFVPSAAGAEFAEGTDESNIAEATREPFPTT